MTPWFQCFALGTALSGSQLSLSLLVAVHVYMCVCFCEHACLCVHAGVCTYVFAAYMLHACVSMHVPILLGFPPHPGLGCSAGYHLPLPTRQTPYLSGSLPTPQKALFPCGECEEVGTVSTAGVRHLGQLIWIHAGEST